MRLTSLGSGSKGNSLLVTAIDGMHRTTVMFDCGFGIRDIHQRLKRVGCQPEELDAVFITHEHGDHANGILPLAKRYGIPLWMSNGTFQGMGKDFSEVDLNFCRDGDCIEIGSLKVTAFTTSHDAREPLQFHLTDGVSKIGMLTDTGQVTPHIQRELSACHLLLLECNYDEGMLRTSHYPEHLKRRIRSVYGHLSNDDAASFLMEVDRSCLRAVVACHLSQNNNLADYARKAIEEAVSRHGIQVMVADQENGTDWIDV
ncbi:MAG: MBL fold metallo-hydrolase [Oxalobacter sp.]|nr:MBL fold metallo-hydrolase [Oxalobacter sp.]